MYAFGRKFLSLLLKMKTNKKTNSVLLTSSKDKEVLVQDKQNVTLQNNCVVVGTGVSAGGLEALDERQGSHEVFSLH